MKKIIIPIATLALSLAMFSCNFTKSSSRPEASNDVVSTTITTTKNSSNIYDIPLKTITGKEASLGTYKGKKILIVNVASECGFTAQYEDLQKFHEQYKDKVVVLGFPANNFGGQEPGSEEEIHAFCKKNFGVTFPLFSKMEVVGDDQHPLYQWLSSKDQNGWNEDQPTWNFCKYLIDENGQLMSFYASAVKPFDEKIVSKL